MLEKQRIKNDIATADKRDAADHLKKDHRDKNDDLTTERRHDIDKGDYVDKPMRDSREKNDDTTVDNRSDEDKEREKNRVRNDEATALRREAADDKSGAGRAVIAVLLLAIIVLEVAVIANII